MLFLVTLFVVVVALSAEFTPLSDAEYMIQKQDGPAAGYFLTSTSDERNSGSYWVHTQRNNADDDGQKWKIILTEVNSQPCYKFQAIYGPNDGRMLTAHSDVRSNGDTRALVHKANHNVPDECWIVETIGSGSYKIKKSQNRHAGDYLAASLARDASTYWADVTSRDGEETLWNIFLPIAQCELLTEESIENSKRVTYSVEQTTDPGFADEGQTMKVKCKKAYKLVEKGGKLICKAGKWLNIPTCEKKN